MVYFDYSIRDNYHCRTGLTALLEYLDPLAKFYLRNFHIFVYEIYSPAEIKQITVLATAILWVFDSRNDIIDIIIGLTCV